MKHRLVPAIDIEQAAQASPILAKLYGLAEESRARLKDIAPLLPPHLLANIKAGSVEDKAWCLLVSNASIAAKLKQWVPELILQLQNNGWDTQTIRIKIASR